MSHVVACPVVSFANPFCPQDCFHLQQKKMSTWHIMARWMFSRANLPTRNSDPKRQIPCRFAPLPLSVFSSYSTLPAACATAMFCPPPPQSFQSSQSSQSSSSSSSSSSAAAARQRRRRRRRRRHRRRRRRHRRHGHRRHRHRRRHHPHHPHHHRRRRHRHRRHHNCRHRTRRRHHLHPHPHPHHHHRRRRRHHHHHRHHRQEPTVSTLWLSRGQATHEKPNTTITNKHQVSTRKKLQGQRSPKGRWLEPGMMTAGWLGSGAAKAGVCNQPCGMLGERVTVTPGSSGNSLVCGSWKLQKLHCDIEGSSVVTFKVVNLLLK